jgi:hypothetical protein
MWLIEDLCDVRLLVFLEEVQAQRLAVVSRESFDALAERHPVLGGDEPAVVGPDEV